MSCHRCFQDNKEAFNHATCIFSTRHDPVVFLLKILLNVKKEWLCFCYCESTRGKCLACQFRNVYKDDEYEIYQNFFDLHFLVVFHQNMYDCLLKLMQVINHVVCKLINLPFHYKFKDWFSGENNRFDLNEIVTPYEKTQIRLIQKNNCKVIIEPLKV